MDFLGFTSTSAHSSQDGYFQKFVISNGYKTNSLEVYLAELQCFVTQDLASKAQSLVGWIFPIMHWLEEPLAEEYEEPLA